MKGKNSKANPQAPMAVRCSAWFGIVLMQSQKSPAHSVRNRCDDRPCHRASDPKTLCALCVLCGKNQNGITAKNASTAKKEQPQNLSHSTPTYGPRRTTQAQRRAKPRQSHARKSKSKSGSEFAG